MPVNRRFLDQRPTDYLLSQDVSDSPPCPDFPTRGHRRFKCPPYMQNVGLPHSREALKL